MAYGIRRDALPRWKKNRFRNEREKAPRPKAYSRTPRTEATHYREVYKTIFIMHLMRFERMTFNFGGWHSIQLSYRCKITWSPFLSKTSVFKQKKASLTIKQSFFHTPVCTHPTYTKECQWNYVCLDFCFISLKKGIPAHLMCSSNKNTLFDFDIIYIQKNNKLKIIQSAPNIVLTRKFCSHGCLYRVFVFCTYSLSSKVF